MIQQRKKMSEGGDGRWHSPDRDLANCWQSLVQAALDQLAQENWKDWFKGYFEYARVTEPEIGKAAEAYARYMGNICHPAINNPREAMEMAGWFDVPPAAQVALFMKLGQVVTMAFFNALRDVTPDGEAPPLNQRLLYESARRAYLDLAIPQLSWWRRALVRLRSLSPWHVSEGDNGPP